jgi:hypothetical protein
LPGLIAGLPTDDVYISIDKDCLLRDAAFTNWEAGLINLDWLLGALKIIKKRKNIVGLDITGEYSRPVLKGRMKNLFSRLDHPKQDILSPEPPGINSLNESTNLKILDLFLGQP